MVNYSAYWQAQQHKQSDSIPQPQKELKQPKNCAETETANATDDDRVNSATALA
jgi:hypothetical protein